MKTQPPRDRAAPLRREGRFGPDSSARPGRRARGIVGPFLFAWTLALGVPCLADDSPARPNLLLIAIDDLNDWVGCLGGHPQARTPNLDRLARRGVLFANAHCPSPLCSPSRTAIFTGLPATATGIYDNSVWFRNVEQFKNLETLPQALRSGGYETFAVGKLFHTFVDGGQPKSEFQHTAPRTWQSYGPLPPRPLHYTDPGTRLRDWGVYPPTDAENCDHPIASHAAERLRQKHETPFFLAVGFFRPHAPFFASAPWFDRYPRGTVTLPPTKPGDLDDVPPSSRIMTHAFDHSWVMRREQWPDLVQAYLACVSFVDSQVGRVLDALDAGPHRDDTLVVLWSDHGFHLGEKEHFGKTTLWERSTRVPLIVAGPGVRGGVVCQRPVSLLDVYPTLLAAAGLPARSDLAGSDLHPLLRDPRAEWGRPALITYLPGNHAVRSERWRYIRYADGAEELYDHEADPDEWTNLAADPEFADVIAEHRRWLPAREAPPARGAAKGTRKPR